MPGDTKESPPEKGGKQERKGRLLDWLDVLAKLVGAGAVFMVAVMANSLQGELTAITVHNQRELAESQLRSNMFSNLTGPIFGSQKDGNPISADRELLLVELLALNFHQDFEMKPLMEDAADRLMRECLSRPRREDCQADDPREPLWSYARRVADMQISSINWQWTPEESEHGCEVYWLFLKPAGAQPKTEQEKEGDIKDRERERCVLHRRLRETFTVMSPDNQYTLSIIAVGTDPINQTVDVRLAAIPRLPPSEKENEHSQIVTYRFIMSLFDLPLTDNTVLPDGNRFAFNLRRVDKDSREGWLRVIRFPKGYFTARERPFDYRQMRQLLHLDKK